MIKKLFSIMPKKLGLLYINFIYLFVAISELLSLSVILLFIFKIFKGTPSSIIKIDIFHGQSLSSLSTYTLILSLMLFAIVRFFFVMYGNYEIKKFTNTINKNLKLKILKSFFLFNFKNKSFEQEEFLTHFINNIDNLTRLVIDYLVRFLANLLIFIAIITFIYFANPEIFYYVFGFSAISVLICFILFSKKLRELSNSYFASLNKNTSDFKSLLENAIEIRMYDKVEIFQKVMKNLIEKLNKDQLTFTLVQVFPRQFIELLVILTIGTIFIFLEGKITTTNTIIYLSFIFFSFLRIFPSLLFFIEFYNNLKFFREPINFLSKFNFKSGDKRKIKNHKIKINSIELKNVSFKLKNKLILKNQSFKIKKNDRIVIKGLSGSGKTTLIKIILGLHNFHGEILVNNKSLKKINHESYETNFSYVPQKNILLNKYIYQNITLENEIRNIDLIKLKKLMKNLSIKKSIKSSVQNLSGGETQRILIARSLYFEKNIQIYDESLNALDKKSQVKILNYIMAQKNKTIIFISHDEAVFKKFNKAIEL